MSHSDVSGVHRAAPPPGILFAGLLVAIAVGFYLLWQSVFGLNTALNTTLVARYKIVGELADLQRSALRAQMEVDQWLLDPTYDLNEIVRRYAVVIVQGNILRVYADLPGQEALFDPKSGSLLHELQSQITAADSLVAGLENPATAEQRLADLTQLKTILATMDLIVKQLYDRQEIAATVDLGSVSRQARDSQNLIVAVGIALATISVGGWLVTRRIGHT